MEYNLFIEHHEKIQPRKMRASRQKGAIGTGWEDDFTNILSFYLNSDRKALENLCQLILGKDYAKPMSIETQYITKYGRPDIVITLASGSLLIIECKVDATLQPEQLQRYLKIESKPSAQTYVALFSKRLIEIPENVLEDHRYKRPETSAHYFWTDLYGAIPRPSAYNPGTEMIRSFFLDYFGAIGFAPSSLDHHWSNLFEDRTIDQNRRVQKEFGRKLSLLRKWLKEQNYKISSVSHSSIQSVPKSGLLTEIPVPVYLLLIGPARARKDCMMRSHAAQINNEVLRVAFTFDILEPPEISWSLYQSFPTPMRDSNNNLWWPTKPYIYSNKRVRLEFVSNLYNFIESGNNIEVWIKSGCVTVIDTICELVKTKIF